MKCISIIIPVHNTETSILKDALEDVIKQLHTGIELIIVDDASTDVKVCQYLERINDERKNNIKVISLHNSLGAANARNIGLEFSTGEYVIFLDSDDRFDKDMLRVMYESAKKENADVCICNFSYFDENGYKGNFDKFVINKQDEEWLSKIPMNPWTRLVRRDYLIDNDIRFQILSSCNDVYYATMTMLLTDKICVLGDRYFVDYRLGRTGAISTNRNSMNLLKAFDLIYETIAQKNPSKELKKQVDIALLKAAISEWNASGDEAQKLALYNSLGERFKGKLYKTAYINEYVRLLVEEQYESKWFLHLSDYSYWLEKNSNKLMKELCEENCGIYLLGLGKRGQAFLEWAKVNEIAVSGISDNSINEIIYENKINIANRVDVLRKSGVICVASNNNVYDEIFSKTKSKVINLQNYCMI